MNVTVKNAAGTSRFSPPTGFDSWLEYWESLKGKLDKSKLYCCPACGKLFYRNEFDGAHVERVYADNRKLSIVPLCSGCNHRTDNFAVESTLLVLVPSNL